MEIVERIANGETLNAICKGKPGMPHPTTFRRWVVNNPDLAKAFTQAIIVSASALEEEALDAARAVAAAPRDGTQVRAVEVKLQQLRWSAERRNPGQYGTRSQVNIKVPIQINTSLDLASGSAAGDGSIYTIEAQATRSIEDAAKGAGDRPLVAETPIRPGNQGKRVLVPPSGVRDMTPFSRMMRGIKDERPDVRPEGDNGGDREGGDGPGPGHGPAPDKEAHGPEPVEQTAPEPAQTSPDEEAEDRSDLK